MDKFNPYILLIMRWLQNSDLVSKEELKRNRSAAYAAYYAAVDASASAADYAAAAYASAMANNAAYYAARAYQAAYYTKKTKYYLTQTNKYLSRYFELTNKDRKAYENRAKHLNVLGVNNG